MGNPGLGEVGGKADCVQQGNVRGHWFATRASGEVKKSDVHTCYYVAGKGGSHGHKRDREAEFQRIGRMQVDVLPSSCPGG